MVKTLRFHCRGAGLIAGQGTKIPHASRCSQNKQTNKVINNPSMIPILQMRKLRPSGVYHMRKITVISGGAGT